MKRTYTLIIISLLFLFNPSISSAQQLDHLEKDGSETYAKLYLHTDRESYFLGDSIWFKGYYVNGQTQQFIEGFYNMYVDLINEYGKVIYSAVQPLNNGVSTGNINVPYTGKQGNYAIRAYTDFQKVFGEEAYFYKELSIDQIKSSSTIEKERSLSKKKMDLKIDVAFFSEGGILLANRMNVLGVKAIDESGKGISVKGKIVDSKGLKVASFETAYKGMGKVHFYPKAEENYTVSLENFPKFEYKFEDIKQNGIKVEFAGKTKENYLFSAVSNSKLFLGKEYYFAFMHKGTVFVYQKFIHKKAESTIQLQKSGFPGGINRIVLLDEHLKPISERLFFMKNYELNDLKVSTNQKDYETRSSITLDIFDEENMNYDYDYSSLSVAIIDESTVRAKGLSTDILSYLLLDSELKGAIESPGDYFSDGDAWSSDMKLNHLMLIQGWNKYVWNDIPEMDFPVDYKSVKGIKIQGTVNKRLSRKPVINGEVLIGITADNTFRSFISKTNSKGRFSLDSVLFTDTAAIFIQARNIKGKPNTRISLDPIFENETTVSKMFIPSSKPNTDLSLTLFRQKYYSDLALKAFDPAAGSITLDEIVIRGNKAMSIRNQSKLHGNSFHNYKIKDNDVVYLDIIKYLAANVIGVQITGANELVIRGGNGSFAGGDDKNPLFLLNGAEIDQNSLEGIPMNAIYEVDVLKDADETMIYGSRGINGVIAVYTKKVSDYDIPDPFIRGALTTKIVGFSSYREFYSPKYTTENINSKKPDNRLTLYWNPNVITKNGKASMSFFTSDDISNFRVYVEGITSTGRICIGTVGFKVSEYNLNKIVGISAKD